MDDVNIHDTYSEFCEKIEDKIFDTGIFTKYLGKNFDLSIDPVISLSLIHI